MFYYTSMTSRKRKNRQPKFNGKKLAGLLKENNMSYQDVSDAAKDSGMRLSKQGVSQHVRGLHEPRTSQALFYARYFGLTVEEFYS